MSSPGRRRRVLGVWVVAALLGAMVAALTKIGPVLLVLPGDNHGLHEGDVVALVLCGALAADLTRRILRGEPPQEAQDSSRS